MQRSDASPRRLAGRVTFVLIATALALLVSRPAPAQGTDGALPDPISARQLTGYADRLGLSPQQRLAAEPMHERYREGFRVLREGEITKFMEDARSMQGTGMLPDREKMVEVLERMEAIRKKIERLDDDFLDSIQPILTEEQAMLLPRVKEKRERERATGPQIEMQMRMAGCPPIDLSDMVPALALDPVTMQTVDPTLAAYERLLTKELNTLNRAVYGMYVDMFDKIAEAGHADFDFRNPDNDPEEVRKVMESWQAIFADLMARTREIAGGIRELNDRTYKTIRTSLSERPARSFRNLYVSRSYPEATGLLPIDDQRWIDRALDLESLTAEEREGLQAAAAEHYRQIDVIVDEAVKTLEDGRGTFSPFEFDEEAHEARQNKINDLTARSAKVREQTLAIMTALLGEDVLDRVRAEAAQERPDGGAAAAIAAAIEGGASQVEGAAEANPEDVADASSWSDRFVPQRISRRELASYRERLAAGEDLAPVVDELYAKYREAWESLEALSALREANTNFWQPGEGSSGPTEEKVDRIATLRREAIAAVRATDDSLFEDLRTILSAEKQPALDRLALNRRRAICLGVEGGGSFMGGNNNANEDSIDVAALAGHGGPLSAEGVTAADGIVGEYEGSSLPLLQARLDAELTSQTAMERFNALQSKSKDAADQLDFGRRYEELVGGAAKRAREAGAAVAALNRSTIDRLTGVLNATDSQKLRLEYNRKAFPTVYKDEAFVGVHLTKALEAPGLAAEQRTQLGELAASYRPEYERLSQGMIELTAQGGLTSFNWQDEAWAEEFRKVQDRQQKIERLRFDRDELNFRTITRLRALLSEEEIARLGGLPEPKEDRENTFLP